MFVQPNHSPERLLGNVCVCAAIADNKALWYAAIAAFTPTPEIEDEEHWNIVIFMWNDDDDVFSDEVTFDSDS